jgi:hypothetical protein
VRVIFACSFVLATIVLIAYFGSWTGEDASPAGMDAIVVLATALPWAVAWLACAYGLGVPLRLLLARDADDAAPLQLALGIALLLLLIAALGRLGLLQLGGNLGAWALLLLGMGLCVEQLRRNRAKTHQSPTLAHPAPASSLPPSLILLLTAAPAIAVMLLATTSAPGWLWATEFGGYDALSYHLQLPKEWLAQGAITPLEHTVYSFLPGYVEGAFYHLMTLHGSAISAVYAAQMLHASLAVVAAWLVMRFVLRLVDSEYAPVASAVVLLGTPWVVVAGSLAYNEMAVMVMMAGGLLALREPALRAWQRGAIIGVLTAAACGAKLTAVGFVAVPLVVLLLMTVPLRAWRTAIIAGAVAGAITLSPYLIGNAASSGNPVFPFATSIFGTGHWTEEQAAIWYEGHRAAGAITDRASEAWNQLFRYGIGANPYENEPWIAQWSILPWLAIAAMMVMLATSRHRSWGLKLLLVVLIQFVFWVSFTHIKSRFMLPMVVPAAAAIGVCLGVCLERFFHRGGSTTDRRLASVANVSLAIALLIWSIIPVVIFARERDGAPAAHVALAPYLTGEALSPAERETIGRESLPALYLNYLLPPGSRVLFVGEAAPFYYTGEFTYQTTWDRGPLSHVMREDPDDPAAWIQYLRSLGYTHVLVNPVMLRVWERSRWNDPLLTLDRVMMLMESHAQLEHAWGHDERLYRLP